MSEGWPQSHCVLDHRLFFQSDWCSSLSSFHINSQRECLDEVTWRSNLLHVLDINNEHNWLNRKIHSSNHINEIKAKSFIVLFWSNSKRNVILVQIYRDVSYGSVCQTHFDISALEIFEMKLHLTHISWDMCWAKFKWCMSLLVGKGTWHTVVLDCAIS